MRLYSLCKCLFAFGHFNANFDCLGFLYPVVNEENCVQCGLCEKICAFNKDYSKGLNLQKPDVYAVRHKEMKEIEGSRSGAMFVAISDSVLDKGEWSMV